MRGWRPSGLNKPCAGQRWTDSIDCLKKIIEILWRISTSECDQLAGAQQEMRNRMTRIKTIQLVVSFNYSGIPETVHSRIPNLSHQHDKNQVLCRTRGQSINVGMASGFCMAHFKALELDQSEFQELAFRLRSQRPPGPSTKSN